MTKTRDKVLSLLKEGKGTGQIARELGLTTATISYHRAKLANQYEDIEHGVKYGRRYGDDFDWSPIQRDIDAGMTIKEIESAHGISNSTLTEAFKSGTLVHRQPVSWFSLKEYCAWWDGKIGRSCFTKGFKKRFLREGGEEKCSRCGIDEWMGDPVPLQVDHIDGDPKNNKVENLRLLCMNCHGQTPTWGNNRR